MSKHKDINGFTWICEDRGIHTFQKQVSRHEWEVIECTTEQLTDGDIEFMTEHGRTLSKERKRDFQKSYSKKHPQLN